ncbi:hypothetical protein AURDEDRAFT_163887 [Auricularia subglabra TFB-10046 SS5]|nr:hypothetical protein AURDEDRAFT_163887 [Auricularia subglabra TFB-10046 SS5]
MTVISPDEAGGSLAASTVARNGSCSRSMAAVDRLPIEVLAKCMTGFSLDDLLPLRLVSKTWLAAVDLQDVYSRDINYWPSEASLHHWASTSDMPHMPISLELLTARLNCSTRVVRLRICTCCLPDGDANAVVGLISKHIDRMEVLWIRFLAGLSQSVFDVLLSPVTQLRDLYLDIAYAREIFYWEDYTHWHSESDSPISFEGNFDQPVPGSVIYSALEIYSDHPASGSDPAVAPEQPGASPGSVFHSGLPPPALELHSLADQPAPAPEAGNRAIPIPPLIFDGCAPALQKLSLSNCSLDPLEAYPAFSGVRWLKLTAASRDCVSPTQMLALCRRIESLDVTTRLDHTYEPFSAPHTAAPVPAPPSVRLEVMPDELDHLLATLTSAASSSVTITSLDENAVLALFGHLLGLGPLTFTIDTDGQRDFMWTQMTLVNSSKSRARAIEIHDYDHWDWEWQEPRVLEFFETAGLAPAIDTIHVTHRKQGHSNLGMLAQIRGQWPAVRTVRVDLLGGKMPARRPWHSFPELENVVLFDPLPYRHPTPNDLIKVCSLFLDFFAYNKAKTAQIVVTNDYAVAELVTSNPGEAANHPLCAVVSTCQPCSDLQVDLMFILSPIP